MKEQAIIKQIRGKYPELEVSLNERTNRIWVRGAEKDAFKDPLQYLKDDLKFGHITTITADDDREKVRIIYHLVRDVEERAYLNFEVDIDREDPIIETVTDIYPAANLYEREEFDLVGVTFEGHPNLKRLMLPEDTPEGEHPLRKSET
ncbi:MAG: hypothetical protein GWO20_15650 [Candidatus Korarchaeota archaeon]|nr:hypothetical protein [Candidatus Korarchaeota archaeon]NIU84831.1 hypothetical protein [Candidatus Thorarchaeota archaeon]NIW14842.1 hypothetical protein [Candidatus Thorarchaeota archaeon]NIW52890.1 hypothetical protein [Candidatus Korarchaeota archaeon]